MHVVCCQPHRTAQSHKTTSTAVGGTSASPHCTAHKNNQCRQQLNKAPQPATKPTKDQPNITRMVTQGGGWIRWTARPSPGARRSRLAQEQAHESNKTRSR